MINYAQEKYEAIRDEMTPLVKEHWLEVTHYPDIDLDVDHDSYQRLSDAGTLKIYTARDVEQKLIGYCFYFVSYNFHYRSSFQASQDVLYIDPTVRGKGFGREFIDWCDKQLSELKVQVVYQHVKKAHNFGPMLESIDYELVDLIYARRLD